MPQPTPDAVTPDTITPDTKDWTVVLAEGCGQCGFDPDLDPTRTGDRIRGTVSPYRAALHRPDARDRPEPTTWSPLEYGCHVRDVARLFARRLDLMLTSEDARFDDWDQDAAAVAGRYHQQDPSSVAEQYAVAAGSLALAFDAVRGEQWQRRGTRSNGSEFTVATFAAYLLHDLEHHLVDVAR